MLFSAKLCALSYLCASVALADEPLKAERVDEQAGGAGSVPPSLKVQVKTTFPDSEVFGIKVVNGQTTTAVVAFTNNEPDPIKVRAIGGALWTLDAPGVPSRMFRNLSTTIYESNIAPGSTESYNYKFVTNMHPQPFRLALQSILVNDKAQPFTVSAFNATIDVVEPPQSIFDPQIIFLYLVLVIAFAGTAYFVYNTWVTSLFPQQKKRGGGRGGERAKGGARASKKADTAPVEPPNEDVPITTGSRKYDESWIPAHHIQRPEAKRSRSGTPTERKGKTKSP